MTDQPMPAWHVGGRTRAMVRSAVLACVGVSLATLAPGVSWAATPHPAAATGAWAGGDGLAATPGAGGGAPISRAEVISRAATWVAQRVPYSQLDYWQNAAGSFRQDCSGYVSMAWGLSQAVNYWTGNLPTISRHVAPEDLAPGDILLSPTHVVIFAGWSDPDHTRFNLFEEAYPGVSARYVVGADLAGYLGRGFEPRRYERIVDTPASVPAMPGVGGSAATAVAPAAATPASWAAVDPRGARHAFAIGPDGALWTSGQDREGADAPYGRWRSLGHGGAALTGTPVALTLPGGALTVVAVGADGHAFSRAQTGPGGDFGPWRDLGDGGVGLVGTPTALTARDGSVELFALDRAGSLVTARQRPDGAGAPGRFASLGNGGVPFAGVPAAVRAPSGQIALAVVDKRGHVWTASQAADGATFGAWHDLGDAGAPVTTAPALAISHSGAVELYAVNGRGRLAAATAANPAADFSPWRDLGEAGVAFASGPAVVRTATGHMQVFVRDAAGRLASTWESPGAPTGFAPWHVMGENGIAATAGVFTGTPAATLSPAGGVAVASVDTAGQVWASAQPGPWQPFTPWGDLRAPAGGPTAAR